MQYSLSKLYLSNYTFLTYKLINNIVFRTIRFYLSIRFSAHVLLRLNFFMIIESFSDFTEKRSAH